MVRSHHLTTGGGIDGLSLRTHTPRAPGAGEVAVHAASLSFRELLVLRGQYVLPVEPDVIPVSDGAGEVVAVGPDVRRVRPGDRVTAALFPRWLDGPLEPSYLPQLGGSLDGMLTELAVGSRAQFIAMNDVITAHRLRPVLDRTFPFEQAAAAYGYYATAGPSGKVIIKIR
ncbi:alcohol dehydrogenase catalytic domain-containing protein [Streptomyces sp. NPDC057900]|uniref:alcohol dehydrogenase catalytic domain-containing protein n=1 Tax=Streptomyces sp. NPDC057900 TaxID=3346274 RepID=UPI0036F07728